MKIAITGHTAGIGLALARKLGSQSHEIIGISRRDGGHNIRNIAKTVDMISPADMWINNAQSGYAQTELLYKVWRAWRNTDRVIWIISTMLTIKGDVSIADQDDLDISEYRNQKYALDEAFRQLRIKPGSPPMCLIRPGSVATQPNQIPGQHGADPDQWADVLITCWNHAQSQGISLAEISLGHSRHRMLL